MSQAQPASKLQTATLVALVFTAVLALGSALDLRNALYVLGHLNELKGGLVETLTLLLGTIIFPWVTILSGLFALAFKRGFAPIAAAATLLGLTIQLLGTLYGTVTQSGYRRWEFREQILGVYSNEYIGLHDWIAGIISKLGVYAAMAVSVVILIQFLRSRSQRMPMATPGFAPAAAPATPAAPAATAQAIVGYDTKTGAPIYGDAK
jgi:hypothetical protein